MDNYLKRIVEQLSQSDVFSHLIEAERLELAGLAMQKSLKKRNVVFFQGDEFYSVIYIAKGALRSVINSPDGREYVVYTWEAGEEFWPHTLLDGDLMPSTLEAVKATTIYQWPGEKVFELLFNNRVAVRALIRRQTQLIRKRRESIYNLAFNPVASRLAKLIVDKFVNVDGQSVQRDLTLEDMASMTATSPEVICRLLYQFQNDGFLSVDRASITLRNHSALEKLIIQD